MPWLSPQNVTVESSLSDIQNITIILWVFVYKFHKYLQHTFFDDHVISVQSCCYMPLTLKNARNVKVKYFSVKQQSTKNVCEWQICTPCTVKSEKECNQRRGISKNHNKRVCWEQSVFLLLFLTVKVTQIFNCELPIKNTLEFVNNRRTRARNIGYLINSTLKHYHLSVRSSPYPPHIELLKRELDVVFFSCTLRLL